jgi:ribosomal protein S18 acetylase RimI-like enzyme
MASLRFGALDPRHRGRLAEILAATAAFAREEIEVALELFDEAHEGGGRRAEGGDGAEDVVPPPSAPCPPAAYEFVGAFDDTGTLTGYACYGPTPGTDRTFDLYWIAVHPVAQRVGEGTRLLEEVERRLRTRGARLLVVETSSRDAYAPTRRFYAARGYREAARIGDFYAPADHRVIYTKRLTRAVASPTGAHSPPPH